jgi:Fe-S cluster assembly protein SufD
MGKVETMDRYLSAFKAFAGNGAAAAPAWLQELREVGISQFAALGFPSTRQERWRFTSVKPIIEGAFAFPGSAPRVVPEQVAGYVSEEDALRIVFVNGSYDEGLSSVPELPAGVAIEPLARALERDDERVRTHLGRLASMKNPFTALNTAFAVDGAFVFVPTGVELKQTANFIFLSDSVAGPQVSHPRNLIVVEDGARVRVIETYAGLDGGSYLTNAVTEVLVGDNARVDCYRVQRESPQAYHIASTHSKQRRDSWYSCNPVVLGAELSRHDVWMVLDGEGGEGLLNGLYVMGDNQHVDHNTVIEHAKPRCESHEYFNGILDDRSRAVFNGRIVVRPGAQKTDSKQTNNNLLLSEHARADSQPQLEIYADDVKCTHGATLGPLDDNTLFYLQSRGMSAKAAQSMLTYGFCVEILDRIEIPQLRDHLEELVKNRLEASHSLEGAG